MLKCAARLVVLLALGCRPAPREGAIVYSHAPHLTLDIAVPEGDGPFPAVLFIHGGSWVLGDLSMYEDAIQIAARRGFVGIAINYELAHRGGGQWPAQIEDVRCALRWAAANAGAYRIDPARVAAVGDSAGGHLAMMAGYAANDPEFEPAWCPHRGEVFLRAVVSLAGVDDLRAFYETTEWWQKPRVTLWLDLPDGARVTDYPHVFANADPITYLAQGPHIAAHIFQGTADATVLPITQRSFLAAAETAGQDITIEYREGAAHTDLPPTEAILDWLAPRL